MRDDFNGTKLNTSLWTALDQIHRGGLYHPSNVAVHDGMLWMKTAPHNRTVRLPASSWESFQYWSYSPYLAINYWKLFLTGWIDCRTRISSGSCLRARSTHPIAFSSSTDSDRCICHKLHQFTSDVTHICDTFVARSRYGIFEVTAMVSTQPMFFGSIKRRSGLDQVPESGFERLLVVTAVLLPPSQRGKRQQTVRVHLAQYLLDVRLRRATFWRAGG